jgi:endoglucanase Acf2
MIYHSNPSHLKGHQKTLIYGATMDSRNNHSASLDNFSFIILLFIPIFRRLFQGALVVVDEVELAFSRRLESIESVQSGNSTQEATQQRSPATETSNPPPSLASTNTEPSEVPTRRTPDPIEPILPSLPINSTGRIYADPRITMPSQNPPIQGNEWYNVYVGKMPGIYHDW